ncbi:hypothetical protein D9M69_376190 [compost metagenome]
MEHQPVGQHRQHRYRQRGTDHRQPVVHAQRRHQVVRHIGAGHVERAVREIGHVQDAVDQGQAKRHQAVDAAQRQAVEYLLKKQCHGVTSCGSRIGNPGTRGQGPSAIPRGSAGRCHARIRGVWGSGARSARRIAGAGAWLAWAGRRGRDRAVTVTGRMRGRGVWILHGLSPVRCGNVAARLAGRRCAVGGSESPVTRCRDYSRTIVRFHRLLHRLRGIVKETGW